MLVLKIFRIILLVLTLAWIYQPQPALASDARNVALVFRGVAKTVLSIFQVPAGMMQDSTRVMFPFGLVTGAVTGSIKTLVGTMSGVFDIARGAAPYAKYAMFAI